MAASSFINRRMRSTFLTSMLVISFVLLLLGLFSSFALYRNLEYRERQTTLEMRIVLSPGVVGGRKDSLENYLTSQPWAKAVHYVSKEEAAMTFAEVIGDDYTELTDGVNPLPASFNVNLKPEWVDKDSIAKISAQLERPEVERVSYPTERMAQFKENVKKDTRFALIAGIVVLLIAFFIIHSTIRLAIFSKRLVIRSMQLIGATNPFIRKPFILMGTLQGFAAGVLADLCLILLLYFSKDIYKGLGDPMKLVNTPEFVAMLAGIVIFGAVLGWLSSRLAVNRFLNRSLDELM